MATTIKLKNGSGAPLAGDLVAGEPALDLTNKRLYTEDSGGTVIEIGTNPSTIDINAGTIDGTVIGGSSAAAGTFTTFTSTGIDDNATANVVTIAGGSSGSNSVIQTLNSGSNSGFYGFSTDFGFEIGDGGVGGKTVRINNNGTAVFSHNQVQDVIDMSNASSVTVAGFTSTGIDDNATSTAITIDSSENVGIGATSPSTYSNASELVVDTGLAGGITVVSDSTAGGYGALYFADGTTGDEQYRGFFQYNHNNSGTDEMLIGTAGTTRVTIDSDGYTGIGTDGPQMRLHVAEDNASATTDVARFSNSQMSSSFNAGAKISIGDDTIASRQLELSLEGNGSSEFYAYVRTTEAGGPLFLGTATVAEAVTVASAGNVGIGTTSPAYKLSVHADAVGTTYPLKIENGNTTSGNGVALLFTHRAHGGDNQGSIEYVGAGANNTNSMLFKTEASGVNGMAERMRIDSSGNLLHGKTSSGLNTAGAEFTTAGQVFATSSNVIAGYFNRQGATGTTNIVGFRVANSDAGTIQSSAGGTPAFAAASDERLKDNIIDHESELTNVMALRPVRWDWKDEAKGSGEGFVAQELEQTAWADLVSEGEDGYKMVSGLGAVETRLIKALQEAVTRIETLEAEVAALKGA